MTAALEGGEWSAACSDSPLPPGKTRYPFYRRLGGPQGRSGRAENLVSTGIRPRTVQPVVSRYTDWATEPTYTGGLQWNLIYRNGLKLSELNWRTVLALGFFFFLYFIKHTACLTKRAEYLKHDNYFISFFCGVTAPNRVHAASFFTPVITALNAHDNKGACIYCRSTSNDRLNFCFWQPTK